MINQRHILNLINPGICHDYANHRISTINYNAARIGKQLRRSRDADSRCYSLMERILSGDMAGHGHERYTATRRYWYL